jgi:hypothetical protein
VLSVRLPRRPVIRAATPKIDGEGGDGRLQRSHRRRARGLATYRLVRYADDFVVLVNGDRAHAEALRDETAAARRAMGLRLSETKTRIVHVDEGFRLLGFPHPAWPGARLREADRLHLSVQAGLGLGQG